MAHATLTQAVRAHRGEVTCADAAGARLASGCGRGALRLWRWAAGEGWRAAGEARTAHRYGVTAVRWAGGAGALLASGGVDGTVRVWGGRGEEPSARAQLAAPGAAAVRALCWAGGGGARLAAGHDDGAVRVWAAARGALLAHVAAHEGALHALTTIARDALLLTACTDGVLKVYDITAMCAAEGEAAPLQWVDAVHDMGALCAAAAEGGALAATGGHDARIRVWRVARAPPAPPPALLAAGALEGHTAAVTALHWGGGDAVLASASLDRTARLWAPAAGACLQVVAAHSRYLTCVVLAPDLRYMITGSNDKSLRMWSLGALSLADELEPPCEALAHFALGDLQGIGPVEEEELYLGGDAPHAEGAEGEEGAEGAEGAEGGGSGATLVWSTQAHAGAVNCITAWDDLIATASSDGTVKVWRRAGGGRARLEHTLEGRRYPALAAELGAGAALASGGLDGGASVWDARSGVLVRALAVPGGGVRGARLSPHRPPLLLLATDAGLAPLFALADPDPHPVHVYEGHAEAATCCAWSGDGRAAATGAASGELRVLAPPPRARVLHHRAHAHDLGVLSCDFAPSSSSIELPEGSYVLASAGCDSLVKLWLVELQEDSETAHVVLTRQVAAHGGAVASVRWGGGEALLATAGEDRWARVWRVRVGPGGAGARVEAVAAVPARGAGGALACALGRAARGALLAVGTLSGELALWRLDSAACHDDDDGAPAHFWGEAGVTRWLRDYIIYAPGSCVPAARAAALEQRARTARLTGERLVRTRVPDLLQLLAPEEESIYPEGEEEGPGGEQKQQAELRERLRDELGWLRSAPASRELEAGAPHALLCPLSHRMLREPARAADGYTYERASLREWLLAVPEAVSPVSGRRLSTTRLAPNYALRDALRAYLRDAARAATSDPAAPSDLTATDQPPDEDESWLLSP